MRSYDRYTAVVVKDWRSSRVYGKFDVAIDFPIRTDTLAVADNQSIV